METKTLSLIQNKLSKELLEAKNYKEFLQVFCNKKIGGLSYSNLAKRSGFSSRAYLREIVLGHRKMSSKSAVKIIKGMKLTQDWGLYFSYLLALDYPELMPELTANELILKIKKMAKMLKLNTLKIKNVTGDIKLSEEILKIPNFALIYAAIGLDSSEITPNIIATRTDLNLKEVKVSLSLMENLGLINISSQNICSTENHLFLSEAGKSKIVQQFFISALLNLKKEAERSFDSNEKLFHQSYLCVKKSKLKTLKQELNKKVLDFVNDNLDSDGDKVISVVLGLI